MKIAEQITTHLRANEDYNADRLRGLRAEHRMSQDDVARKIGVSRTIVARAEKDQASFRVLRALARLYAVPWPSILFEQ